MKKIVNRWIALLLCAALGSALLPMTLRAETSAIDPQIITYVNPLYADTVTDSMRSAIDETNRRRKLQTAFNEKHGIVPKTIIKDVREIIEATAAPTVPKGKVDKKDKKKVIASLTEQMREAAKNLQFERAALLRDKIQELKDEDGV